jgi:GrpB-like predicted nucleotidyltransferase (UPF0157 family)
VTSLRPVHIVEYEGSWPVRFQELAARVRAALGPLLLRVEHIGSTAVPGLAAKPIIDLDVIVASPPDLQPAILKLEKIGYVHRGDLGISQREAFHWPEGEERHHLYLLVNDASELKRHVAFRNALRADPALRDAYSALKRSLAAQHARDRAAYTDGKADFVRAVLRKQGVD